MKLISTFKSKKDNIVGIAPKAYIYKDRLSFRVSLAEKLISKKELMDWIRHIYKFYGWERVYKNYNICDDMENWICSVERDYKINRVLDEG